MQVKHCGERLSALGIEFDGLVASPLGRTLQTVSIVAGCGRFPDVHYDDRLAEVSVGSWDGLSTSISMPGGRTGSMARHPLTGSSDHPTMSAMKRLPSVQRKGRTMLKDRWLRFHTV
ncbi:histidine phosphatase family protein [Sphingopyxis sp. H115]|uniref:histidine phosphatase family protein n=1 Tax=Sphingopyxis sp. H115 TaxID=1759073 RepID=UPI0039E03955